MKRANVALQIEELVLQGVPYSQRQRVAAALEAELTRLLAEQGLPSGWEDGMPPLQAAPVQVSPHLTAEGIGQQVAQAVYAGFSMGSAVGGEVGT